MTIEIFSRDWAPIGQLIVMALGLVSLLLLYWQIRMSVRWNKINAHMQYFWSIPSVEKREKLDKNLKRLGIREECIEGDRPLNDDEVELIVSDPEATRAVKRFLNDLERLCIAVNSGATDEDYAYAENSHEVVRIYNRFEKYIVKRNTVRNEEELYIDLKKAALRWAERDKKSYHSIKNAIAHINRKLDLRKGVKKRYP